MYFNSFCYQIKYENIDRVKEEAIEAKSKKKL